MTARRSSFLRRFCRAEDGAALVEFGLLLPMMMLFVGLCVEGARTYWSYQTTITGVRDATRYLSRVVDRDICTSGNTISEWDSKLTEIVRESHSGESLFPPSVRVETVTATLACQGGGLRGGTTPVATVSADLSIGVPFAGLFSFAGVETNAVRTNVSDSTRVLGL